MSAIVSTSQEFDNIDVIINDLKKDINKDLPNAFGILICDSMIDYAKVSANLSAILSFPIVGGTTLSFPFSVGSKEELSASLIIFSKENINFSISISESLQEEKSQEQMQAVYNNCTSQLREPPKIIIPFFPLMPGVMIDKFINNLFTTAGNVPVFGGVTTDDLIQTKAAVFLNGKTLHNQMILLMINGDINPVFSVGSQVSCMAEYAPAVTKSENNIVYEVDNMPFCDYLKSLGISPENRINGVDALLQYGPLPVQLREKLENDDDILEIRCISNTNIDNGSVAFSSNLPLGTKVNVSVLDKEDVKDSAINCLKNVKEKMQKQEADGYEFSMLFCVSCVARYFALVGVDYFERQFLDSEMPKNLPAISYYGFCEICPTGDLVLNNRSHNASIIMCAF